MAHSLTFTGLKWKNRNFYAVLTPDEALKKARDHFERFATFWEKSGRAHVATNLLKEMESLIQKSDLVLAHNFDWEAWV